LKKLACLAVLCALSGCGPGPSIGYVNVAKLPQEQLLMSSAVQVLTEAPQDAAIVGVVEATSCKNKMWSPDPTEADALAQLKVKAAGLGANAIVGISYSPSGTSLVTNCWTSIMATGTAVRTPA
jgi:hypothetical protein